ncbi:MAG: peptidoglycan editing factor PgeF [Acidobacteria bacterium]|nr:peptidoglycan editing factor PgeF [Acidobacteriota bacterium]
MTANLILANGLSAIPWVRHGFGTRQAGLWTDGLPSVCLKQIHSDLVLTAGDACGLLGEGDAVICGKAGVWIGVRTADCVPILLADRERKVVAAIHAGWRGTAAGLVGKALARMKEEFGTEPVDVTAAVGPCIGGCCYEVGDEVAARFGKAGESPRGRALVDLAAENVMQLSAAGVRDIEQLRECTRCNEQKFHSYRRDGERAGRMVSAISIAL